MPVGWENQHTLVPEFSYGIRGQPRPLMPHFSALAPHVSLIFSSSFRPILIMLYILLILASQNLLWPQDALRASAHFMSACCTHALARYFLIQRIDMYLKGLVYYQHLCGP